MADQLPVLFMACAQAWDDWLGAHHAVSAGAWLKIAKRGSAAVTVSYDEAVTVAICHGWIDGRKGRFDDDFWLQRFTPRKPGSRWSEINTERAAELIAAGRMTPAGLREVELARADGRWQQAYEPQSRIGVPADLARALDGDERARAFFATLDSANRYAVLYRVAEAKRPDTRARRIATFVAMLARTGNCTREDLDQPRALPGSRPLLRPGPRPVRRG